MAVTEIRCVLQSHELSHLLSSLQGACARILQILQVQSAFPLPVSPSFHLWARHVEVLAGITEYICDLVLPFVWLSFMYSQSMENLLWVFLHTGNKHLLNKVEELATDNWFHKIRSVLFATYKVDDLLSCCIESWHLGSSEPKIYDHHSSALLSSWCSVRGLLHS